MVNLVLREHELWFILFWRCLKQEKPLWKPFPPPGGAFAGNVEPDPLKQAAFLLPQTLARSGLFNGESSAAPSVPPTFPYLTG